MYLTQSFKVDTSIRQRFILNNSSIDTSLLKVYVNEVGDGYVEGSLGTEHFPIDNIVSTEPNSNIYLIQEVQDEKYELLFGDGLIGKKVGNNAVITANYILTDGKSGNGARDFSFAGTIKSPSTQANEDVYRSISGVVMGRNYHQVMVEILKR